MQLPMLETAGHSMSLEVRFRMMEATGLSLAEVDAYMAARPPMVVVQAPYPYAQYEQCALASPHGEPQGCSAPAAASPAPAAPGMSHKHQQLLLTLAFSRNPTPAPKDIADLAAVCGMPVSEVDKWFASRLCLQSHLQTKIISRKATASPNHELVTPPVSPLDGEHSQAPEALALLALQEGAH